MPVLRLLMFFFFIPFVFGIIMTLSGYANLAKLEALKNKGIVANASLSNILSEDYKRGLNYYRVELTYSDENDKPVTREFLLDQSGYRSLQNHNNTLQITYVPGEPDYTSIGTSFSLDYYPIFFGYLSIAISLLFIALLEVAHRKRIAHASKVPVNGQYPSKN